MPSAFEQRMTSAMPRLYTSFGVPAVYVAPSGTTTSGITVRIQRGEIRQTPTDQKTVGEMQTGQAFVQQSDLAKPVKNGRFAFDSGVEVWSIETTPILKNGQWNCTVKRVSTDTRMEKRIEGK